MNKNDIYEMGRLNPVEIIQPFVQSSQIKDNGVVHVLVTLLVALLFFIAGFAVGHTTQENNYRSQALEQIMQATP